MLDLRGLAPLSAEPGPLAAWQEWRTLRIAERLSRFDPVIVSSLAAGLQVDGSDLDVVCDMRPGAFLATVQRAYGDRPGFTHWTTGARTMVAFAGRQLRIELAGEPAAVECQPAYRHAVAQRRLAELGGPAFVAAVTAARQRDGLKTEPAIARVLGLEGDPYGAVQRLADASDAQLRGLLSQRSMPGV